MKRTIEIIVSPQGEIRLETRGFSGSSCREASRLLEQGLGARINEQLTPEYYVQTSTAQHVEQGGAS